LSRCRRYFRLNRQTQPALTATCADVALAAATATHTPHLT
jgi:hypothetical protein